MSRDFYKVATLVLAMAVVLQQAVLGNALLKLEAVITEIEQLAEQQGDDKGGWVFIELNRKDK
jgi:hypothetical protein